MCELFSRPSCQLLNIYRVDEVTGRLRGLGRKDLDCIVRRELQSFDTIDFNIHITGENRAKIDRWMVVNHFPVENDHWMVSAQMYELMCPLIFPTNFIEVLVKKKNFRKIKSQWIIAKNDILSSVWSMKTLWLINRKHVAWV